MKSITRALLIACLALPIVACNKEEPQVVEAAPVAVPQTADRTAWRDYLQDLVPRHMEGINNTPFIYLVPPPAGTEVDGEYDRLLEKAQSDVARGIVRGNLLTYAGADSARTADLVVSSFEGVAPNTMNGVRVIFVGAAADNDRVKAAVTPAGVEYVFVDTAR
ncbi:MULTISPECIES: hypothetical protein [Luteimonas]|uniref:hypothetical protein n=1 Tax=Luteimonas TaxID=83614 RepID=UPI000C7C5E12|nr:MULTISPECIES: hypothetical protein [Luteimonas]